MNHMNSDWRRYESIPPGIDIVYAHDIAGNLTFLNHEAELVSGYSCEEAQRMNLAQLVAPEFAADISEQIGHTVRDVLGSVYELDIITKDGRRVALEVSTEVIAREGQPVQIQGIAFPSVLRTRSLRKPELPSTPAARDRLIELF